MPIKEAGVVHAKWCGHCKDLMPKWEEFSKEHVKGGQYNGIQINAYEEGANKDIIGQKGIKAGGFPHFYSIDDKGKVEAHNEVGRDVGGIKMWLDQIGGGETEKKEGFGIMSMFGGKKKRKTAKKSKKAKKAKKAKKSKRKTAKKSKKTKKRKLFGLF